MNIPLYPMPSSAYLHNGVMIDGCLVVVENSNDTASTGGITSGNDKPNASSDSERWEEKNEEMKSESTVKREYSQKPRASLLRNFVGDQCLPVEVSFSNLKMEVPDANARVGPCASPPRKTILSSVTGVFEPGKFTAIMGSSGAGKTTLLNAVAGEAAGGILSGAVRFNGAKVDTATIRRLRAFVFQDDVVMGTMTAYEAISMSAKLRLPPDMPLEEKMRRVDQMIEILHLERCKDNVIGYPGEKSGVSGGERKRISIAMELITNPSVLFLDEPTSGLDTHTAHSVCKTLKELAAAGRTVVATIHQPSSDIFHMFDNLLLLASGRILYQGPSRSCMDYFATRGSPCPQFTNPADHIFMKVLNDQLASSELERKAKREQIEGLLSEYAESSTFKDMEARVKVPGSGVDKSSSSFSPSLLLQMSVLFGRAKNNAIRNRLILRAKIGQSLFMGLLVGLIYRDLQTNQRSIQDRTGALFFVSVNVTMSAMMTVITAFGVERVVFERERSIGMYRWV
uniref:ABC transporter domain-containing protein n=1 Tax=Guillardia theta TaxID=55529 RepID=A0A7S4NXY8_GUITH